MPYIVNFTDKENKTPITVFDNTSSQDTSLTFPGRNVTGYGQIIAENFLSLLENFASANQPVNPVEGQLWYDTSNNVLQLYDNTSWKAASNIQKGPTQPSVETAKVGELWVDTANQQLRIYTGSRWLLVGPSESSIDGKRYGPAVETIADTDNTDRSVLILYIADVAVAIVSKDSFTPKIDIAGFDQVKAGINIATPANADEEEQFASIFLGGSLPQLIGTAKNADALNVGGVEVAAGRFLRSDQVNTTEFGLNVRNNSGIVLGVDGNFQLTTSTTAAKIYNSSSGSSVDIQTNRNGVPSTIVRVIDNKVGINVQAPDNSLDVDGNIGVTGALLVTGDNEATNLSTGTIRTAGGVAITKNLRVGTQLNVSGTTTLVTTVPATTDTFDLGTDLLRWNNLRAKTVIADQIIGTIEGNITGNANTATNLKVPTSFNMTGDVVSSPFTFDGSGDSKTFTTSFTANLIANRPKPTPAISKKEDQVVLYRPSASVSGVATSGLLKLDRNEFMADGAFPIGAIAPFAGPNVPYGYLLCDGSLQEIDKYGDLYGIISNIYQIPGETLPSGTFRLPDLRGRFPLGLHNMDNGNTIPQGVAFTDAGGGAPNPARVEGTEASTLGSGSGSSSVSLVKSNLPEHEHDLVIDGEQFFTVRVDTAPTANSVTNRGPNNPGEAQYATDTGGVKVPSGTTLGSPFGVMNPFQTLNYIIRSGPPAF